MKQPRVLKPGMRGGDVYAVKRALRRWAKARHQSTAIRRPVQNGRFDAALLGTLKKFQSYHGPIRSERNTVGPKTWSALENWIDPWGRVCVAVYAKRHPQVVPEGVRQRVADELDYLCTVHDYVTWAETRPIPLDQIKQHDINNSRLLYTDCSGSGTGACYAAGAPDPNGLNYNGEGYTGTLLTHLTAIPSSQLQVGDPIVFGAYPGLHVVWTRHPVPVGEDIRSTRCMSLGHNGGSPDEPAVYDLGVFIDFFAGHQITYLTLGLP